MEFTLTETDLLAIRALAVEGKTEVIVQLMDSALLADYGHLEGAK